MVIVVLMINNIKNYLYDKKYFINIYDNYIHVFNFLELLEFSDNKISIQMDGFKISIKGKAFFINKMTNNEILVNGFLSNIEIINE